MKFYIPVKAPLPMLSVARSVRAFHFACYISRSATPALLAPTHPPPRPCDVHINILNNAHGEIFVPAAASKIENLKVRGRRPPLESPLQLVVRLRARHGSIRGE